MFKKIISTTASLLVLLLCLLIVLRCCASADRSVMKEILPNDTLTQAYSAGTLTALTTKEDAAALSEDGYFSVYGFVYFPECKQVQLTIRYNRSLYKYADQPEGTEFTYTLGDEKGNNRISPSSVESLEKGIYRYRRLTFDNVEIGDTDILFCYMQLTEEYESEHPVRYAEQALVERKLTGGEKRALGDRS